MIQIPKQLQNPEFSFYENGISNTIPSRNINIIDFIKLLKQGKEQIEKIRKELNKDKRQKLKEKLSYVTFGGTFNKRGKRGLKKSSGLACFDIDDVKILSETKQKLIENKYTHFLFLSPSGNGFKVLVRIPKVDSDEEYKKYWISIAKHYNLSENDEAAKDISRACYVSVDDNPYYNPNSEIYTDRIEDISIIPIRTDTPMENKSKDTSRSGLEFRRLIALFRSGKTREEAIKEMQAYSKWVSAPEQYRQHQLDNAENFVLEEQEKKQSGNKNVEPTEEILNILKNPDLFNLITEQEFNKKIVGEIETRKTIFLVTCMRLVENLNKATDNLILNALSGTGKDYITEAIFDIINQENKEELIRISPKVLAYTRNKALNPLATWKGVALRLEDIGNDVLNDDAFKVMASANPNKINHSKIVNKGKIIIIEIEGKPSIILTIANANPREEQLRRFPICYLSEEINQTKEILVRQGEYAKKGISTDYNPDIIEALKHLKRIKVRIPYADMLVNLFCPENVIVRTHFPRFLDYIKASCSLHQYQRQKDDEGYYIAEPQDYDIARIVLIKTTSNILMIPLSKLQKSILDVFEAKNLQRKSVDDLQDMKEIVKLNITDAWLRKQLDYLTSKTFLKKDKEKRYDEANKIIPKPIFIYDYNPLQKLEIPEFNNILNNNTIITINKNNTINTNITINTFEENNKSSIITPVDVLTKNTDDKGKKTHSNNSKNSNKLVLVSSDICFRCNENKAESDLILNERNYCKKCYDIMKPNFEEFSK